jgi:hypothetical protein
MRLPLLILMTLFLTLPAYCSGAPNEESKTIQIGSIDYFGYARLSLKQVEDHLPLRVGDRVSVDSFDHEKETVQRVAKQFTGKPATDIAAVCCDKAHRLQIYIGLSGTSSRPPAHNAAPLGHQRLEDAPLKLYESYLVATEDAVRRGASSEDDAGGYALSDDPLSRQADLAMRAYAASRGEVLEKVLQDSSDAQQRRASAALLGYADRSAAQIQSLTEATGDVDEEVRNNAVRALWVLASAKDANGIDVAPMPFIALLSSGQWTDRNKSSLLLEQLTRKRDPILLKKLHDQALAPLIEGARWTDPGHYFAFLAILGRIGAIPEPRLQQLIQTGEKSQIIEMAERAVRNSSN